MASLMVPCIPGDHAPWGKAKSEPKFRPEDPMMATCRLVNRETGQVLMWNPYRRQWVSPAKATHAAPSAPQLAPAEVTE